MSIYKSALDSFYLVSEWACAKKFDTAHPQGYWAIVHGPTEASQTVTFPVELPAGAVIAKAWIGVTFTHSPKGGVKYRRINGETLPASGEFPITVTADMTSFEAVFTFASYGTVEEVQGEYSGSLGIGTPTLYVDYVDVAGGETGSDDTAVAVGNTSGMRLPRLLDANLHEKDRLHCVSLKLEINADPLSTADMALPSSAPAVEVDDFVELFSPYGSEGIFRIYRIDEKVGRTRKCFMRHGIVTLADDLVTAGNAITAPVGQVFSSLFAMQSAPLWVMGDCETPADLEIVLERNYQTLLEAFTALTAKLPGEYMWKFDQTVSPWRAHLRAVTETDACEFRMRRNIQSLSISTDRDAQCTRVYAFGAGDGDERIGLTSLIGTPYLDVDDIEERGVKAKSITKEDIYDALTLKDVAQRYLDRHKDPDVSITVDGVDLFRLTGVPFDKFHLGQICRVPLPASGRIVREKVVSIRWPDVIGKPSSVTATLASRLRNVSDELADLMREATNGKLIGGTVDEKKTENNNDDVTQSSSLVHYFDITGYGNALTVRVDYTPAGKCLLLVDSEKEVPANEAEDGSVDILRYLKSDENGVPLVGEHNVQFFARGVGTLSVHSEVTVKTIEKR